MKRPKRGIETMFKITSVNLQRLSALADNKAHILITVNSIILSVIISVLLRKIEQYPKLQIPVVCLLLVNVTTVIFAVLATRPLVSSGTFTPDQLKRKDVNLIFFGNFHSIPLKDYMAGMKTMLSDGDFLYQTLIHDIYSHGASLNRKYRLLRIGYSVFMYGIVTAVAGFLFASMA